MSVRRRVDRLIWRVPERRVDEGAAAWAEPPVRADAAAGEAGADAVGGCAVGGCAAGGCAAGGCEAGGCAADRAAGWAGAAGSGRRIVQALDASLQRAQAMRRSLELSQKQHTHGHISIIDVLDIHRKSLLAELALSEERQSQLDAVIALCRAMGGGWREQTGFEKAQ